LATLSGSLRRPSRGGACPSWLGSRLAFLTSSLGTCNVWMPVTSPFFTFTAQRWTLAKENNCCNAVANTLPLFKYPCSLNGDFNCVLDSFDVQPSDRPFKMRKLSLVLHAICAAFDYSRPLSACGAAVPSPSSTIFSCSFLFPPLSFAILPRLSAIFVGSLSREAGPGLAPLPPSSWWPGLVMCGHQSNCPPSQASLPHASCRWPALPAPGLLAWPQPPRPLARPRGWPSC
jgi:hypothetical protein